MKHNLVDLNQVCSNYAPRAKHYKDSCERSRSHGASCFFLLLFFGVFFVFCCCFFFFFFFGGGGCFVLFAFLFQNERFNRFFHEYHLCAQQFGSRSGPTCSKSWNNQLTVICMIRVECVGIIYRNNHSVTQSNES